MAATAPARIRPFRPRDRSQVLALAPRLTEGAAPWRDPAAVRRAAQNWIQTSIGTVGQPGHAVYVATALMNAAEAWAARRGVAFLTLHTGAANQPARGLYRQLGYREEELLLTKAIASAHA